MTTSEPEELPSRSGSVPLAVPDLGEAEMAAVVSALRSGFVSSVGPAVEDFEQAVCSLTGSRFAVACSSGSAALHVAARVAGVCGGTEVLVSDFTFIGSVNPVRYLGAEPVLVDSEQQTWNIDPSLVIEELHRRARSGIPQPAAVIVVHIFGQPAKLAPILEVAALYGVPVIEDAAESLGARWVGGPLAGRQTGSAGTLGVYSFNGNKVVTCGGGGMVVTDDDRLAAHARHLTQQAKVAGVGYLHDEVGYNYRLTNLSAALGKAQLGRIQSFLVAKQNIAARYDVAFQDLPLHRPTEPDWSASSNWLYSVLAPSRDLKDRLLVDLHEQGVEARPLWRPLHAQPPYAGCRRLGGDVADGLFERGLSLPSSVGLDDQDQQRVIKVVRSFFSRTQRASP